MRPKCDFIHCFAGMGLAGTERCFLNGEPQNPDCPKFKDEDEALVEWKEEEEENGRRFEIEKKKGS